MNPEQRPLWAREPLGPHGPEPSQDHRPSPHCEGPPDPTRTSCALEASGHSVLRACSSGRKSQPTPSPCQRLQEGLSPQGKSLGVMAKSQAEGPQQTAGNQQLRRILQFSIPGSGSRSSAGRLTVRWFFREGECLRRGALDRMWNPGGGVCPEDKGIASHGSCR